MNVSRFEERVLRELKKTGAIMIVGIPQSATFYVRMRKIMRERGFGKIIRGAFREGKVHFWLYSAYRTLVLTEQLISYSTIVDWPKDGVAAEDIIADKRMIEANSQFGAEWVDEIEDWGLPMIYTNFIINKLERVETGKETVEDFEDYLKEAPNTNIVTPELKDMLRRKLVDEIDQTNIKHRPADYKPKEETISLTQMPSSTPKLSIDGTIKKLLG